MFVDERGFVPVDKQQRTNVAHIFAIGDVVGQPMLAHKATHEGKVAAENTAGHNSYFDATVIPSVAYTDPEVAWVGVTENEAKAAGVKYGKGVFPWAASGRSLSLGRAEGMTKVLFDEATDRVIGAGIVGPAPATSSPKPPWPSRSGADAADIGLTIHPHPTLSETVGHVRRGVRGHHHRPLHAQEEEVAPASPGTTTRRRPFMPGSVIVGGARTPIGKLSGALKGFTAMDLGGFAIKAALERSGSAGTRSTT